MVSVVLGRVYVNVRLKFAAELHELDALCGRPRHAVISLDKPAENSVRPILDFEPTHAAPALRQNHFERGRAVKRRVGILAQYRYRLVRNVQ